jgi:gamma-glutamylcyclotransferase (GGCT)/AIG2-like uncharacterized protein YtfP
MEYAGGNYLADVVSIDKYYMDGGGYPYINLAEDGNKISGELYEVTERGVTEFLDALEGHPSFYCREIREFVRKDTGETIKAWIYILVNKVEPNKDLLNDDDVYVWTED